MSLLNEILLFLPSLIPSTRTDGRPSRIDRGPAGDRVDAERVIGGGKQMVDLRQETVDVEYCHRELGDGSAMKVVECRIC